MAKDYRVFVHLDALVTLPKTGKRRAAVIRYLQILGQIAHLGGDYEVKDPETGRPFNVSQVAGYAITWWIDGPVGEVKVVDITSAN
ncbi:MAG: hypothetical protein HKN82_14860 [Akkermansiaceae bacterium]|nr:hypothetical protein [Akkermansiaceae bacterium]